MNDPRRNSGAFFVLGALAFAAGLGFWAMAGRASATVSFACSAVVFAAAWLFERIGSRDDGPG
ncbi:hypothetical protein [Streptomyces sp. C10-9-1]|uniref:hypothetical protein n=1 Tax=Streptomyces sp. C10-9-1 TaxID=1859285 RepID=UPI003D754CAF